jgi:hypothetical protein
MPNLPHLAFVVSKLIVSLRAVQPHLGAKQRRSVTDTLPSWISPDAPPTESEGRGLARLLTNLTAKTTVRTTDSSTTSTKAESLAQPFSKHALYVLVAYIRAVTDPLCTLSPAIRRELEPGLFALCGMMGEHGRDAVMMSMLDAGGKQVLKSLWKEYEKQKYVGQG